MNSHPISEKLREACIGHPNARIPWPHRLLHDAADTIDAQAVEIERLRGDKEASDHFANKFQREAADALLQLTRYKAVVEAARELRTHARCARDDGNDFGPDGISRWEALLTALAALKDGE